MKGWRQTTCQPLMAMYDRRGQVRCVSLQTDSCKDCLNLTSDAIVHNNSQPGDNNSQISSSCVIFWYDILLLLTDILYFLNVCCIVSSQNEMFKCKSAKLKFRIYYNNIINIIKIKLIKTCHIEQLNQNNGKSMLNTNTERNIHLHLYTTENIFNDLIMTKNDTKLKHYKGKSKTSLNHEKVTIFWVRSSLWGRPWRRRYTFGYFT